MHVALAVVLWLPLTDDLPCPPPVPPGRTGFCERLKEFAEDADYSASQADTLIWWLATKNRLYLEAYQLRQQGYEQRLRLRALDVEIEQLRRDLQEDKDRLRREVENEQRKNP